MDKTGLLHLAEKYEAPMLDLLREMVEINSYTYNKKGVDRVGEIVSDFMTNELSFKRKVFPEDKLGNNLLFSRYHSQESKPVMFCGHMDTVFPPELGFNEFKVDNRFIYGPGVIDMKGGLVVGMFALVLLKELGLLDSFNCQFLFNSDEEIGSPSSRNLITQTAKECRCAFVLECGGLNGEVVTGRKGKFTAQIEAHGKSGHAAFIRNKKSAILELAHKTIKLEELNDFDNGVTVNVGVFNGGMGPNSVAENATIKVDARFKTFQQERYLKENLKTITLHSYVDGVVSTYQLFAERPPMEQTRQNKELYSLIKNEAIKLDIPVQEEFRFGVSDANLIAEAGIPVVDGMGPCGDKDHSTDEYMIKETFKQRSVLLAATLIALQDT